jgi:hypothetical protein
MEFSTFYNQLERFAQNQGFLINQDGINALDFLIAAY